MCIIYPIVDMHHKAPITGLHLPHITMNKVLMGNAFFLGSYARYEENRPLVDTLGGKMMV